MIQLLSKIVEIHGRRDFTKEQMQAFQEKQLRRLLHFAFHNSHFYRQLYLGRGITEDMLDTIKLSELPLVSKELLMEHFDDVVTDKSLKKKDLQVWIEENPDTRNLYKNEFVVIHTSGTSGNMGIFVYDQKAWNNLKASLVTRVSTPSLNPLQKTRIAFYAATHGRFAGISLVNDAPSLLYDIRTFSLLKPIAETLEELNAFQPHQLSGYASTIAQLALFQKSGKLSINPMRIMVGGDVLTHEYERVIKDVWECPLIDLYAASESVGIAARLPNTNYFKVFDDLQIVEVLDDNNEEVAAGKDGQVVLTNLYNFTFPMIRYQLGDIAVRGHHGDDPQFSSIKKFVGRANDALPILLDDKKQDSLHPIVLSEFFVSGVEKVQFVMEKPGSILLKYMAKADADTAVVKKFEELLKAKGAAKGTKVKVKRVKELPNNSKTGKFQLVINY